MPEPTLMSAAELDQGLRVFVAGKPAPQGSKRYLGTRSGKTVAVESSKTLPAWRADVRAAVAELVDDQPPITGPVLVELLFVMPRPASTPKSRTPAAVKRPDLDKLARAILDAIGSAGAWGDDSQVTDLHAAKRIAGVDERPGAWITITPLDRS